MARILAIMLFLCKFFFQLPPHVHPASDAASRHVNAQDFDWSQGAILQWVLRLLMRRFLRAKGWVVCEGYGALKIAAR